MKRMLIWLAALLLLAGCRTGGREGSKAPNGLTRPEKPPALTVGAGEREVLATLGTYSWAWPNGDGTSTGVEVDGMHPLDMLDYMTPLFPGDAGKVTLCFDLQGLDLDKLTVRRWPMAAAGDSDKYERDFELLPFTAAGDRVTVDLPDEDGGIFEVHAYFTGESHGDGYYAFCLQSGIEGDASVRVKMI